MRLLFASISVKILLVVREAAYKSVIVDKIVRLLWNNRGEGTLSVSFRDNLQSPYYCFVLKDVAQFPFKVKS